MGKETLRSGIWYPELVLNDLTSVGALSAKRIGCDIMDKTAKRYFYDKKPFAILAWKQDDYAIVAFAPEIPEVDIKEIVAAFVRVFEYTPFVFYELFQNNEYFKVFEWAKKDSHLKMIDIMKLPNTRNIQKETGDFLKFVKG